jgi:hypothetical protein
MIGGEKVARRLLCIFPLDFSKISLCAGEELRCAMSGGGGGLSPRTKGGILVLVGVQLIITSGILWQRQRAVSAVKNNDGSKKS